MLEPGTSREEVAPGGDRRAPRVLGERPRRGTAYALGARVLVRIDGADAGTGVVRRAHRRFLPTRTPGRHWLVVRTEDANGNGNGRVVRLAYRVSGAPKAAAP